MGSRILAFAFIVSISVLLIACGGSATVAPTPTLVPGSDADLGSALFRANCATCHSLAENVVITGPSLAHVASRAGDRIEGMSAEDYFYDSILDPQDYIVEGFAGGLMPQNFGTQLTGEELDQIVAYLLTQE
jgi:mono/diheme cytochrome c family protein